MTSSKKLIKTKITNRYLRHHYIKICNVLKRKIGVSWNISLLSSDGTVYVWNIPGYPFMIANQEKYRVKESACHELWNFFPPDINPVLNWTVT